MTQDYEDIRYEIDGPTATITINRPQRYNAFRGRTVEELIRAFRAAWADRGVRAVLPGPGRRGEAGAGDVVSLPALRREDRRALGSGEQGRPGSRAARRGQGLGRGDRGEEPDRDPVPQAVVQRRHRPPGRPE